MASPNGRRPVTALTVNRPPNDLRAGITAANKTVKAENQAAQKGHDDFGVRQAAKAAAFAARHRAAAPAIISRSASYQRGAAMSSKRKRASVTAASPSLSTHSLRPSRPIRS